MITSFGHSIIVGWQLHQDEWLLAAGTLYGCERREALHDIASMTGRKYNSCESRMKLLLVQQKTEARAILQAALSHSGTSRRSFTPARTIQGRHLVTPRSAFPVSEAAKMSGSARTVKARAAE